MTALLHEVRFDGGILERGFWLYVWKIVPPDGTAVYYVGRTGDSSSTNAQSPFNRMGQHLGFAKNSNMLRRYLGEHGIQPERCEFRLVSFGPLEEESMAESREEHDERRDHVAAMEKALAETLTASGCRVMNRVSSNKALDEARFAEVRTAFARAFPEMARRVSAALPGVDP